MNARKQYVFETAQKDDNQPLSGAIKVSKLKQNQLKIYFNSLKVDKRRPNDKLDDVTFGSDKNVFDEKAFKIFLKRYGLKKKVEEKKPVIKRMPLKTVKTIQMELPDNCGMKSLTHIPPRRKLSSSYIEITKALSKTHSRDVVKSENIKEEEEDDEVEDNESFRFDDKAITTDLIEKELESTQNEILLASTQLEEIKALLAQRKNRLENEENQKDENEFHKKQKETNNLEVQTEFYNDIHNKVRNQVENKIQNTYNKTKRSRDHKGINRKVTIDAPKAEWNLKVNPSFAKNSRKKLMVTLDGLNQRLQKIQDKYFGEPKVKFRTIDQILANSKAYDQKHQFEDIKEKLKLPNVDFRPQEKFKENPKAKVKDKKRVEVILPPKFKKFTESNYDIPDDDVLLDDLDWNRSDVRPKVFDEEIKFENNFDSNWDDEINWIEETKYNEDKRSQKGILKKNRDSSTEVNLGAPTLQNSIFKSNFLMKEFDVKAPTDDFDFGDLKLKNDFSAADFKKNVRFAQGCKPDLKQKNLQQAIDRALKNSLFYSDM